MAAILAIDQGTTSSRAILFDTATWTPVAVAQEEFAQLYPFSGWVEHDPEAIWASTLRVVRTVLDRGDPVAIGIANQRETVVVWDRATGVPIANAIVWQDRRTEAVCAALKANGVEPDVQTRTGLVLDPYLSATKIAWLLDHVPGARTRAHRGELAAGTIDSFLLWRLTGGRVQATDWTNAGRTQLYDIRRRCWDADLLRLFDVPASLLPEVHPNAHEFGTTDPKLFGRAIPITGMAGDQQAALVGHGCFDVGSVKSTYGTGCFALMNTGDVAVASTNRLLTTPAYEVGDLRAYALEGSIFAAGAAVKWLRDKLALVDDAARTEALARAASDDHGVTLVPAFVGMGAPYWRPDVRGAIFGLTLDTTAADLVRATLESVAYQTHDLLSAMVSDGAAAPTVLRVDGGMVTNAWFAQRLADTIALPVEVPAMHEATALGAAVLAAVGAGVIASPADAAAAAREAVVYRPTLDENRRSMALARWSSAVRRLLGADTGC